MDVCTQCGLPLTKKIFRGKKKRARGHFCCYGCYLTFQITREKGEQGKAQGVLIRLGLGIFFAMNVMLFSLPTYSSFFYSLESNGVNETNFLFFLRIGLIAFSTPVLALLGFPILLNSIKEISHVSFSVDTLIALGTFAAYSLSIYNTFTLKEHVYFDTATMLLVLVTLGRYLEARAKVKTADSLNRLIGRTPLKAQLICGDTEKEIDTEKIQVGDKIKILPGQMFPVDGKVLKGTGGVDESSLTGEHQPVYKKVEDKVVSGSISVDGTFVIATEKVQTESTLARIAKLLEEAKNSRAPIERTANQIAAIFIPLVISIAIVACIFWSLRTNLENGLLTSLSVLVVSCPCALGIATPIAIWLAFNQTLQKGILLRNGETLECLSRLKKIFFDKTGTLTSGNLMFKQLVMHPAIKKSRSDLEQKIVSLAAHSSHPIAACILNALPFKKQSPQNVSHFTTHPGLGVEGRVGNRDNQTLYLGSKLFMSIKHQVMDSYFQKLISEAESRGETTVLVGIESKVVAMLTFHEELRPEAESTISQIQKLGLQAIVVTGDSKPVSRMVREKFPNVVFQTGLLPEQKVQIIDSSRMTDCSTVMVGDGINDAPALAAADVGIAVGTGTDLARAAASVNIISHDLGKIPWLVLYARKVKHKIVQNLFWAFFYNVVAIALAAAGLLNPLIAATAMILSSLFVVWNSQQLKIHGD